MTENNDNTPWGHWVQPDGERYTQESLAALALKYFRAYRNDCIPDDLPPDGSRGQYGAFTESMIAALATPRESCLAPGDCDTDFDLKDVHNSCWIAVGDVSVYILRKDDGVEVQLYANHCEMDDNITSAYATFSAAQEIQKRNNCT